MLALSDAQIRMITDATDASPPEKRATLLGRIAAVLALRGRYDDAAVAQVIERSLCGLMQMPAA